MLGMLVQIRSDQSGLLCGLPKGAALSTAP